MIFEALLNELLSRKYLARPMWSILRSEITIQQIHRSKVVDVCVIGFDNRDYTSVRLFTPTLKGDDQIIDMQTPDSLDKILEFVASCSARMTAIMESL